ncbi:MAG: hypothetical protein FJW37_03415 [Acidobacteria bacterium]|nr:hypothetical protein [Acidobacteriota bacterium]
MRLVAFGWMKLILFCAAFLEVGLCQVVLNPAPSRVVGQLQLSGSTAPNLAEGRELNSPQGIALDMAASPPILYVAGTGNNRVLAWRNASAFANGAPADPVIGQKDRFSTQPMGPGTPISGGLSSPTGLAVRDRNLYVADSGNNRILRFPSPFANAEQLPDRVIGQGNFTSSLPNPGGRSASTLALAGNNGLYRASLAFDAAGNLFVTDPGNRRVLRYPAASLNANGPPADLALGQRDFLTLARPLDSSLAPWSRARW